MNFAVDYLSLFTAEKLCFIPESKIRCAVGAIVGSTYSLVAFFKSMPFVVDLIVAFIMAIIVSRKRKPLNILGIFATFIGAEIFIGGCVNALKNISDLMTKRSLFLASFIILLSVVAVMSYGIIQILLRRRLSAISLKADLWHRGRCSRVLLMVDSGNLVREHTTQRRVIFIKAQAIENSICDAQTLFEREKCYVIPIDTTSGKGSVMGFIPDKIEFSDKKYNEEEFIVVPDCQGGKFGGYDGIAPLI